MKDYAVKVGTAVNFEGFLANYPEAALAARSGVKMLSAPAVEPPALDFSKRRSAPSALPRAQGPKA